MLQTGLVGLWMLYSKCAWGLDSSSSSPITAVHRPKHNSSTEEEPLPAEYIFRLIQQHQSRPEASSLHRGPGQASMVHSKHFILYVVSEAWQHEA